MSTRAVYSGQREGRRRSEGSLHSVYRWSGAGVMER
jgi:hypothetical protein